MHPEEFRTGSISLPATDADDLPPVCLVCPYLRPKEFSTGPDGSFYYFCAYHWADELSRILPPCLKDA